MSEAIEKGAFKRNNTVAPTATRVLPLFSLKGRTAIISGAGGGIGLAVARGYAEAGANLILWYNSNKEAEKRAREIADEFGVAAAAYSVDVRDLEQVNKAVTAQIKESGFNNRLDIFGANSGIPWTAGSSSTGSLDQYRKLMATNLDGVFYCARTAGRIWKEQKKNGWKASRRIPQDQTPYNAAKAAVKHMFTSLAVEWVQYARANTVSPGYIRTEILSTATDEVENVWRDKTPMGREGELIELVGAYLYLASDASSFTTGTDIIVDGGYVAP